MLEKPSRRSAWYLAAICLVATIFFWLFVPETKGRSLEEIARHWNDSARI